MNKILAYLICPLLFISSCMNFRTSDKKTIRVFEKENLSVVIEQLNGIRVIKSDSTNTDVAILFIHGTPGSGDAYYDYLKDTLLLSKATLITYDRPGYGYSSYGKAMPSIKEQVDAVLPVIGSYKEVYVVGHSYGGPIAAYLAIKSSKVKSVLMIAPTLYPHKEKFYGMANFGKSTVGRLLTSRAMYVASVEKVEHQKSLEEIESEWDLLNCQTVHVHSKDDRLVPFDNVAYSKKTFVSCQLETIELDEGDHFLPWNHFELIRDEILKMIDN
jgi:pimeloyl-ACP methyl ester carboxylesterase